MTGNYDESKIKNLEFYKTAEKDNKITFNVKYTEELYIDKTLKEEKKLENEITLEKAENEWLISNIR